MKKRVEILLRSKKDQNSLINSNNEIYEACRNKTWFHRYRIDTSNYPTSTDDREIPEIVLTIPLEPPINSLIADDVGTVLSDLTES